VLRLTVRINDLFLGRIFRYFDKRLQKFNKQGQGMTRKDGLLALLVVVVWGLNFVVIKVGLHNMPPLMLAGLRFLLVAFPALFFVARPKIPFRLLLGYGLTISFGQFAFLFCAINFGMPAGLASLVLQAQAFFTIILGALVFGERLQGKQLAGIALAVVGVVLFSAQMVLRRLNWTPSRFIRIGGSIAAVGFVGAAFAGTPVQLWAAYGVIAAGMGWVYPSQSALAANAVEAHEQGAAAGAVGAAQGLGAVLGPLAGTLAYQAAHGAPYAVSAGLILIAALWPATRLRPHAV